jgi:hypothetical protein
MNRLSRFFTFVDKHGAAICLCMVFVIVPLAMLMAAVAALAEIFKQ